MTDRTIGLILILCMLGVSFIFQLNSKLLATQLAAILPELKGSVADMARKIFDSGVLFRFIAVVMLAGIVFALWLGALTRLDLSYALIFATAGLAFSTIGSSFVLGEPLTSGRLAGLAIVVSGVVLTVLS